ncbi:MAG: hypothetical protein OYL97_01175 [Candidatus Poribacteria bacterium]|nr:hypothetical protein [Candidatus Poribacteria bacterium]
MKVTRLLGFVILNLFVLTVSVSPLFAKSPTTPKILFTSARDGNYEVYSMNPDGSEQINLTQHRAQDLDAAWSPTGEKILFVSDRGGKRDLYLMNPDGSNVRRVFRFKTVEWRTSATWSPDGKQFAYQHWDRDGDGDGTTGIYIATFGEQDVELLGKYSFPAWSPDGTEIACGAADPVGAWIIFVNVRTQKRERLLPKKSLPWQRQPSWSATGDKLAFAGNKQAVPVILDRDLHNAWMDRQTIFVVNRDGTGLKQLVDEAGPMAESPELSPNGDEVLYTKVVNERHQIFKLDINTGVQTQLTHVGMPRFGNFGGDWFDPAYALPVSPQPELLTTLWGKVKRE